MNRHSNQQKLPGLRNKKGNHTKDKYSDPWRALGPQQVFLGSEGEKRGRLRKTGAGAEVLFVKNWFAD